VTADDRSAILKLKADNTLRATSKASSAATAAYQPEDDRQ
jgi:hypothetical protein